MSYKQITVAHNIKYTEDVYLHGLYYIDDGNFPVKVESVHNIPQDKIKNPRCRIIEIIIDFDNEKVYVDGKGDVRHQFWISQYRGGANEYYFSGLTDKQIDFCNTRFVLGATKETKGIKRPSVKDIFSSFVLTKSAYKI